MKTVKRPQADFSHVRRSARPECTRPEWAIVMGGGDGVWSDMSQFAYGLLGHQWPGLYIAANDIGCHQEALDHWASFHVEKLKGWAAYREAQGMASVPLWGWRPGHTQVDHVVLPWSGGSSGMLAVLVAFVLGCTMVVLCGVPMTPTPHFVESQEFGHDNTVWVESDAHWRSWMRVHDQGWFEDRVRSMSGRTRELFGEPTREWLQA